MVVFGTQNGNTNQVNFAKEDHPRYNAPMVLAGRCGGALRPGAAARLRRRQPQRRLPGPGPRASACSPKVVGEPAWCKGPLPGLLA